MRRDFLVFKRLQICLLENFIVNFITFQQLWTHLLFISNKVFCRRQIYLRLKNKKSRRVGESPPACVGLKAGFHSGKPESNIGSDRNQHRIGLDIFNLVLSTLLDQKKLKILQLCIIRVADQTGTENLYRKPMRGFSFVPIRCLLIFRPLCLSFFAILNDHLPSDLQSTRPLPNLTQFFVPIVFPVAIPECTVIRVASSKIAWQFTTASDLIVNMNLVLSSCSKS